MNKEDMELKELEPLDMERFCAAMAIDKPFPVGLGTGSYTAQVREMEADFHARINAILGVPAGFFGR